jgi:hypothetical protein
MGELEYDPEYGEGGEPFVEPAADLSAWEDAGAVPSTSKTPVSDRFFAKNGEPRETIELRSPAALEAAWAEQARLEAREAPPLVDSTLLPHRPQGPDADYFDQQAQSEAQLAVNARAYERALYADVERLGSEPRFGVTDPGLLQQVAAGVEQWRKDWFEGEMARGASVQQALQGLEQLAQLGYVQQTAERLMEQARYETLVSNLPVRRWARANWEAQRVNYELGVGPPPMTPFQRHRNLQVMWSNMQGYMQRVQAEHDQLEAIKARTRSYAGPRNPQQRIRKMM